MKRFAELYRRLDATTKTSIKQAALVDYFREAPPEDAAWALHFLLGKKGRRAVQSRFLREWTARVSGHPEWLVEECYDAVGDLAETVSLLTPDSTPSNAEPSADLTLSVVVRDRLLKLADLEPEEREPIVLETWAAFDRLERMLYTKLVTGAFRVGVSRGIVARALAEIAGIDQASMAHRLAGRLEPDAETFARLIAPTDERDGGDPLKPYPFFLAHPVPSDVATLGDASEFVAEWKWDGIRAQAVCRGGAHLLWSRGEDLVDAGFPEIAEAIANLPDGTVLDGELLAWRDDEPLSFHVLQRRIQRKTVGPKIRAEVPVRFLAYDVLEDAGLDVRERPIEERRARLEQIVSALDDTHVAVAPIVAGDTWEALAARRDEARERGVEGLMLKRRGSAYGVGRTRGDWWKWKVDPYSIDAVLVYAQRGSGRRASLYTDYTFAVRDGDALVPVAKAYSGLSAAEIREVDAFVRRNITERFGPVRAVTPELVFELEFEGIQPSTRHKSGVALRFPRMVRRRTDKTPADADTIETVRALLPDP